MQFSLYFPWLFSIFDCIFLIKFTIKSLGSGQKPRPYEDLSIANGLKTLSLLLLLNRILVTKHFFATVSFGYSWIEPPRDKTNTMACAPSEDSDQPGHPHNLIRAFTVRMKEVWVLSYPSSAQHMPRLIWVFAGRTSFCWFCHGAAQFIRFHGKRQIKPGKILVQNLTCWEKISHFNTQFSWEILHSRWEI